MSGKLPVEVLLRPAVELYTVAACAGAAFLSLVAPWSLALSPAMGVGSALAFGAYGVIRYRDARVILRYRRNIRRLPRYVMTSKDVPVSLQRLFVGRGFLWEQKHTHRLMQTYRPEFRLYVEPTPAYRLARRLEERLEFAPFPLSRLPALTGWDVPFNPVRPLPPVGGLPRLHGIEPEEVDVSLPLGERVGHSLVLGTTRVGKTRLAELFVTQDIRRVNAAGEHEVVIVIDPKGDADLLKRMYVEAKRAGREGEFYVFHLGWPDISARYNAVGRFGRISEVATRVAGQLSGEGNSAAFREFAWRFVNIIARALVELGQRPDYMLIQRHVINIDALFIEYAQHYFAKTEPKAWEVIVQIEAKLNEKNIPRNMIGREKRVVALDQYLSQARNYDPVLDGLRSAVRYDKTYFDKIVASLLPLLEKLTSGKIAQLLAPNYSDLADPRPIFDWMQIIHKRAIVYVGLDALSDAEVAAAVGNSMFSDLVSVAGHIYKHGIDDGLPGASASARVPINVHADEFNELMGDEFIPLINKGGGAGLQVTAYTQTLSDIEARIGNRAKAGQVIGNFNNLFMLRVQGDGDRRTADAAVAEGRGLYDHHRVSGATDSSDIRGATDFTSNTQDRISMSSVPMIEPSHVVGLPKGQCFALLQGGQLWKVRMPLPAPDPDEVMPADLQQLAGYMRQSYSEATQWWEFTSSPALQDTGLPDDLLDDAASGTTCHLAQPTRTATRPRHERRRLDRAARAEPPPGLDRRHHHLAVPAARGADRLAAVLDRDGVRRHAPVLEGPGLAALAADVAVRAGAPVQPLHAQRGRAGAGAHGARAGGHRLRMGVRALGLLERMSQTAERARAPSHGKDQDGGATSATTSARSMSGRRTT
jgi:conjugative coupling factor TraD (TOL family)